MQVGDLVMKQSTHHGPLYGVIVDTYGPSTHANIKIAWVGYGTFWSSVDKVELLDASR